MSRADFSGLRATLKQWVEQYGEGAYGELSSRMGGTPTDEAIRLFAEGKTKAPRFAEQLSKTLGGEVVQLDLHEEAARALRLIREGQEALARVVKRMGEAGPHTVVNQEDLEAAQDGDRARADLEEKIARANRRARRSTSGE